MTRQRQPVHHKVVGAALIIVLLPLILPLALVGLVLFWLNRLLLSLLVWSLWLPAGKNALVVYSDSPIWHDYMSQEIIPLLHERAVILNWSERNIWRRWSLAVHVFRSFGGSREFNPLVVLFRPLHPAKTFRFLSAFRDMKHGRPETVENLRRELSAHL